MKKRLPILIVIFGALSLFLILKFSGGQEETQLKDTDGDGYPDKIDNCDSEPYSDNYGCPVTAEDTSTYEPDDKDRDGFSPDAMEESKHDPDDNNPCSPNKTCDQCDEDGDKLTRREELAKGTKVDEPDTDSDGVNDSVDKCPTKPGLPENQGCNLVLNANLSASDSQISWNAELATYAEEIYLVFGKSKISVSGTYQHDLLSSGAKKGIVYRVELIVILKDPSKVELSGNTKLTVKIPQ